MSIRLAAICDRLIEGGWLAALVVTPLFFNPLSARTFEPDKAAMLRVIVLAMVAAWGVRAVAVRPTGRSALVRHPLVLLALALAAVIVLSAALGISPRISLFGSYGRDQGVIMHLAYLTLFGLTLAHLRTADQIARLLDTAVVASVPVALYAVLQRLGADPVPWGGFGAAVTTRVIGTQGNAVFLGAYLALALPLTLYRLLAARGRGASGAMAAYGVALALQALALVFSDSRGPVLGLAAGGVVWALAHAAAQGNRRLAQTAVGAAVAGLVLLFVLNLAGSALGGVPLVGRLSRLLDPSVGSNQVRTLIWQGMSDMVLAHPERLPLGVGPDALYLGFYPYYNPELRRLDNPQVGTYDRSHNEVLDRLATTGIAGLGLWLTLVGGILYSGVTALGLAPTGAARRSLVSALAGGAALGALAPIVIDRSLQFAGLGLGLGLVAGLTVWLAWRALQPAGAAAAPASPLAAVAPVLLGVLVVHFVEILVGIPVTATQALFWTLGGALAAGALLPTASAAPEATVVAARSPAAATGATATPRRARAAAVAPEAARRPGDTLSAGLAHGLVVGLTLATLTVGFAVRGVNLGSAFAILFILGLFTAGIAAAIAPNAAALFGAAVGVWTLHLVFHLVLALSGPNSGPAVATLYVVLLLGWLAAYAAAWAAEQREALGPRAALLIPAFAVVAVLAWTLSVRPLHADMYARLASLYGQVGRWDLALAAHIDAVDRAPNQDFLYPSLAQAYLAAAQTTSDQAARTTYFERARATLQRAHTLSPRNPEYLVNRGAAEQYWADKFAAPAEKLTLQTQAANAYRQASEMAPQDPHALRRWGRLALDQGDPGKAIELLNRALALILPEGKTTVVEKTHQILADIHIDLAQAYAETGRVAEAERHLAAATQALKLADNEATYAAYQRAAEIYQRLGRTQDAIAQARTALSLAPNEAKAAVEALLKQLGAGG